jgi:hypothetical protein
VQGAQAIHDTQETMVMLMTCKHTRPEFICTKVTYMHSHHEQQSAEIYRLAHCAYESDCTSIHVTESHSWMLIAIMSQYSNSLVQLCLAHSSDCSGGSVILYQSTCFMFGHQLCRHIPCLPLLSFYHGQSFKRYSEVES